METSILERALRLPIPERLRLADEIYQSIDAAIDDRPIPDEMLSEMERRDAEYEANPASGSRVDELERELFRRK